MAAGGTSSGMRSGAEYLRSLRDGRAIFVDGERVKDVTTHPAFREAARSVARLFDVAAAPEHRELMTYPSPKTGAPVWRAWQIPKSHDDLRAKRRAAEIWAEATFGLMGRTPDHVAGFIAGYAAKPALFAAGRRSTSPTTCRRSTSGLRDNHLYVTYAIVPPQIDRSKPAHAQKDPTLYAGVVKERDDGIVISGAQQLATAGVFSDCLHLTCIHPMRAGDEAYANGVVIPIDTPGLKLYPRRPYATAGMNGFDYPLSQPVRRDRLLLRVRQRLRAVGERLHLPQPADLLGPVVEDAGASLRQSPGAVPLRRQAALHARARQAHERDDRQRGSSGRAGRDGRARRDRLHRREHAARPGDGGADRRRRRAVAAPDRTLFGDGAAVRAQRPHAGDDP